MNHKRSNTFIALLEGLDSVYDSTPGRETVSTLTHSLQTAQRALMASYEDEADRELVVCALLHDSFRLLAPESHGEAVAIALSDCISPNRVSILTTHSAWQYDAINGTNQHEKYKSCVWYEEACRFSEWDSASFDANKSVLSLDYFRRLIEEVVD